MVKPKIICKTTKRQKVLQFLYTFIQITGSRNVHLADYKDNLYG